MDDSINEYAKKLMERAQARKGTHQLKSQGLDNHPTKMSGMTLKEDTRMIDESVVENKPIVPGSPSNKENLEDQEELEQEDLEEDQDEEMEEEEDAEERKDEITEENEDEVLPLSSVRTTFPLTKALNACPQSASPISRKTRLSALAKSINSWEDDLSTPKSKATVTNPAITSTTPKTPRYSVSTPPVSNRQNNPSRNSCHQFVAKVTVTGTTKPGSPSTQTTPGSPSKYTNNIGVGLAALRRGVSPAKNVSEPSSIVETPKRGLSPIKNVSTLSTPAAPETLPVMALKSRVSPVKNVPTPPPPPTSERSSSVIASPEKPAVSILNKRRMFEKDEVPDAVTAPKISKTTAWPPTPLNIPDAVNKSQPQKFNSRKSLLPDPSELTVAQKAKLFERQQQEQQQLRKKEQEVNQRLNIGKVNKNVAFAAKSEAEQRKMSPSKKPEDKPQFYFGESKSSSVPPPPPPLPSTIASPIKSSPGKPQNIKEDYEMDDDSEEEMDISPSALIAKSVKRIKVIKKEDKMYPSLTDIENTEAETDMDNETNTSSIESSPPGSFNSSMSTSSLGSFIQTKAQGSTMFGELNTTMACRQIDECIDEALAGQYNEDDTFMGSAPLNTSSPIPPKPLMHTVSVYRKKQQQNKMLDDEAVFKTPQNLNAVDEDEEETKEELHDKMQNFEQQILIQQKAISQASKALNICESSFEFSNSTENVEGERVLLIATQKRAQLLSHISKLRNGKQNDGGSSPSKDKYKPSSCTRGTMRMDSIQLYPIKSARLHQDYVYHFIVIIKHNENVYATSTVKTSASSTIIEFPNEFMIQELDPGFKVQVEVYALRTFKQMDVIPHNMKYHIKNSNTSSSGSSTPSKGSTLSQFLTPTRSSKHTPKATNLRSTTAGGNTLSSNSVRTSNFTLQAILNLNLSNLNKTEWEMSLVNSSLILPNISMKIKCTNKNELNYKGFLTVFSDVSGLGAWHRRWAKLDQEYRLVFWTYPEDESQDKPPVLTVSLASCITPRVSPTLREVCARPNTFLLSTTREPLSTDENSLVVSVHEKYTTIKHMFSADNRMERDDWMRVINTTLTNMRAWGIN